ncbi:sulfite exporter TauE/SafE family protein [Lampropedia aestuarii]|uniref:Probable membrane transporter protein n=1 Tax=Lampropedia aestuarii TaxID=2562762 RepID=A0A4S5BS72_9BURK|nr:sulfite exporter TauE/SafE family protein [Lampropedia aestuarii]THJ35657.1 sulfite exporter TauE/SafE family protein [Lampropedia aestuarii]
MFFGLDAALIVTLMAIGLGAGFLAGLLGIGGGMVLVPCLVFILGKQGVSGDLAIKMGIATAMATILFTSLSSVRAHHKRGAIRWPIVRGIAPGIVVGGLLAGAGAFAMLKGQAIGLFFAVFVGYSAWRMFKGATKTAGVRNGVHGFWGLSAVGTGIGFISGLVGAGGGFLSVPYMSRCNVPIHQAVATSAALGFPIAIANVLGYTVSGWSIANTTPGSWGYFYLPALVLIAMCSVMTAPLGAKVAHGLNVAALKKVFALLLASLAAYMLYKSVQGA